MKASFTPTLLAQSKDNDNRLMAYTMPGGRAAVFTYHGTSLVGSPQVVDSAELAVALVAATGTVRKVTPVNAAKQAPVTPVTPQTAKPVTPGSSKQRKQSTKKAQRSAKASKRAAQWTNVKQHASGSVTVWTTQHVDDAAKRGITVSFAEKSAYLTHVKGDAELLQQFRDAKFHWDGEQGLWYAPFSSDAMNAAEAVALAVE